MSSASVDARMSLCRAAISLWLHCPSQPAAVLQCSLSRPAAVLQCSLPQSCCPRCPSQLLPCSARCPGQLLPYSAHWLSRPRCMQCSRRDRRSPAEPMDGRVARLKEGLQLTLPGIVGAILICVAFRVILSDAINLIRAAGELQHEQYTTC